MIKFFRHSRQNLLMENRVKRLENVQWTFLVNEPTCRVGFKTFTYD